MHKSQNKLFDHKLTKVWIVSYICVLILPIIMGIISYTHTITVLSNSIESTNLQLLGNTKTFVDATLSSITNASSSLQRNELLFTLANNADAEFAHMYTYKEKESVWSAHNVFSSYISNKYIYFPQKNLLYHNDSTMQPHYLYLSLYSYNGEVVEEEWYSNILNQTNSGFVQLDAMSGHPKIFHVFPVYYSGKIIYSIIVELNWNALCSDAAGDYAGNFFMSSYNSDVFYSNMDDLSVEAIKNTIRSSQTFTSTIISGKEFKVLKTISSNGNWYYGFSIPEAEYYNTIIQPIAFSLFIYLITILLGLVAIVYIVYRNSLPIKRIVKTLKTRDNTVSDTYDVYSYIENKIASIMDDNSMYFEQLDAQANSFKNIVLSNIMLAKNKGDAFSSKQFELLGINPSYDTFYIVAFCYDDPNSLFFDDPQQISESRKREYAQFIISNIFNETLNSTFNVVNVIMSNANIFLINTGDYDYDEFTKKLHPIITSNLDFIKNKFGFNVYSAISSTPVTIDKLNDSYIEVILAMQYALSSNRTVVYYNQVPSDYIQSLSMPRNFEDDISESLEKGDYNKCKKIIYKTLYDFQTNENITVEATQNFAFKILTTVFERLSNKTNHQIKEFITKTDIYSIFDNVASPSSILLQATTIIDKCFSYFENNAELNEYPKNNFYQSLKKYIDENYTNPDLAPTLLGEIFNINPNYMSTQFKKEFGSTITSYIATLRIENAKRLLLTTNLTNEEISRHIGFSNCRTFLRVFKKAENLTPKEFKNKQTLL